MSAEATWWREATRVLQIFACSGCDFSAEDVLTLVGDPPRPRQTAALFGVAVRRRQIVAAGAALADDGRLLRLWRGAR